MCALISISNDDVLEQTESFAVSLNSVDSAVELTRSSVTVVINDSSSKFCCSNAEQKDICCSCNTCYVQLAQPFTKHMLYVMSFIRQCPWKIGSVGAELKGGQGEVGGCPPMVEAAWPCLGLAMTVTAELY